MNDDKLRRRLAERGITAGPITDTTRAVYLRALEGSSSSKRKEEEKEKACSSSCARPPSPSSNPPENPPLKPPIVEGVLSVVSNGSHSPPSSSTDAVCTDQACEAQAVLDRLSISLNNPSHVTSDTAFLFPGGEVYLVNRGVLATQCSEIIPLLYNNENPFPVIVSAPNGQNCQCYGRSNELVHDLKEKIAMAYGVPVSIQRLVFMNNELHSQASLGSCGISAGATVNLVITNTSFSPLTTSVVSPALSISHMELNLGLLRLAGSGPTTSHSPPPHPHSLPPHIAHIVHIYDVPSSGLKMFVKYLYSGTVDYGGCSLSISDAVVGLVSCYVLGECFHLPSLSSSCLVSLSPLLTVESALTLVKYAESIHSQTLRDKCVQFLEVRQNSP